MIYVKAESEHLVKVTHPKERRFFECTKCKLSPLQISPFFSQIRYSVKIKILVYQLHIKLIHISLQINIIKFIFEAPMYPPSIAASMNLLFYLFYKYKFSRWLSTSLLRSSSTTPPQLLLQFQKFY